MKIAIDISQIAYEGTGVANYTAEMVKHLLKIDKKNDYLLLGMTLRRRNSLLDYFKSVKYLSNNVRLKLLPIPQTAGNCLWNRWHILDIDKLIGVVDIFHSSDWIQPPVRAKKVTTVHDLVVYKYPETSHPQIIEVQKSRLYWVKKECDKVLADSKCTKDDLVKILHFDPGKVEVIYPGVGSEFKPAEKKEIDRVKQKYSLFDEYILTVGTKEPRKNLKRTIVAFNRFLRHPLIMSRKQPIELVIAGKIGWEERVRMEVKYIHEIGYVDQRDLPALYSGASLFVYPSLYEGFGLPVIEAMACETPVITSERGSLKEIAGDSALIVNPEKDEDITVKMTQIFIDEKLRLELIRRGKENAAKYAWENTAKQILTIYQKITS